MPIHPPIMSKVLYTISPIPKNIRLTAIKSLCMWAMMTALSFTVAAQSGTVRGKLVDKKDGEGIISVNVFIQGQGGITTNINGEFELKDVDKGKHTITFSSLGYKTIKQDIVVVAGQVLDLGRIEMEFESKVIEGATVKGERITNTEQAVVFEIQNANQVVSGLSKEQITKSQDNTAAQVIQRVPGVTVVDNRFVMIRGLSERYNNVMINNVVAPSTEVDKRTFSFDLIGSGALDRMLIFKSGAAELPGDFAGGVIKLYTVENIKNSYTTLKFGTGYRHQTSFQSYLQSKGSSTDALGFDNGYRALPSSFPRTFDFQDLPRNAVERMNAAHTLQNNFLPIEKTAGPDYSLGVEFGFKLKPSKNNPKTELIIIHHIGYSRSYQMMQREFNRYFEWVDQTNPIIPRYNFVDDVYQLDNKINILSNWSLKINDKNKIKFKNLFNQIGENETIIRNGEDYIQRPDNFMRNYLMGYRSRTVYTTQVEGTHVPVDNQALTWVVGASLLREDEPDLRRFRTFIQKDSLGTGSNYQMQLPPSSNLFETGRYFGDLLETGANVGFDYKIQFTDQKDGGHFNFGYYFDTRSRTFNSRYFSYLYPGFFNAMEMENLRRLPLDQVFANSSIRTRDGFVLEEGTRPIDSYTASSMLQAGYAGVVIPVSRFKISTGLRLEYMIQRMMSRDDFKDIVVDNPVLSPLPFFNVNFQINPKAVLRGGYSWTINRPEFREFAPFLFYDYKYDANRVGNPDLKTSNIHNFDMRYEYYPRGGETVSAGVFYKNFINPIENRTIITSELPTFSYINADNAQNFGLEIEMRKSLYKQVEHIHLSRLSFNLNYSYIISRVDLGETAIAQDRVRPLQGQSPYIFNAVVGYNNDQGDQPNGYAITANYNIFGNRIFSVGDVLFPTIYELSRHSIDLTYNQKLGDKWNIKVGIQDLLNFRYRFFEDSDRNEKITDVDNPISVFRRGTMFNLSVSYNIK
jgi:hypothetical protein